MDTLNCPTPDYPAVLDGAITGPIFPPASPDAGLPVAGKHWLLAYLPDVGWRYVLVDFGTPEVAQPIAPTPPTPDQSPPPDQPAPDNSLPTAPAAPDQAPPEAPPAAPDQAPPADAPAAPTPFVPGAA